MFNVRIASAFALVAIATSLAAPAHAAPPPGTDWLGSFLESLGTCEITSEEVFWSEEHDWSYFRIGLECCVPGDLGPECTSY